MSARTFVVVYVTFSPRSHPCQTGVHLYPSTYSTKAATGRKAAQRCRAPQPGHWHHHHSVPLTPRRSLLPLALLPWPAEHLPRTSVCLHLRSGQGDGLEVTAPFFEGREENSGYWHSLDGSPVDLQLLLLRHQKNDDFDFPLTTTFTVTNDVQEPKLIQILSLRWLVIYRTHYRNLAPYLSSPSIGQAEPEAMGCSANDSSRLPPFGQVSLRTFPTRMPGQQENWATTAKGKADGPAPSRCRAWWHCQMTATTHAQRKTISLTKSSK